jgi:hypothetical protein
MYTAETRRQSQIVITKFPFSRRDPTRSFSIILPWQIHRFSNTKRLDFEIHIFSAVDNLADIYTCSSITGIMSHPGPGLEEKL